MALSASGAISADDIRTEYGLSGAVSFADLYRGGSYIRQKAADNLADNLASSVPTSGVITLDDFRGTSKGFRYTFTAGATDQNASSLFGSDYSVNYPKDIVINSGVELGASSTSEEALEIDSGGVGTITITNNGTLSGAGGAAGADGGDAFEAAVTCTFVNNGTVRAGGGGGGTGGNGTYNSDGSQILNGNTQWQSNSTGSAISLYYGGYTGIAYGGGQAGVTQYAYGGGYLVRGSYSFYAGGSLPYRYYIFFRTIATSTGGAGGVGAGYGQSAGTGVAGTNNAGSGGDGGAFGASGTSGTNGTSTNGVAGGAGGKYLRGSSFVTFTNNGTVQGGTA
jgi:hypothetical protein